MTIEDLRDLRMMAAQIASGIAVKSLEANAPLKEVAGAAIDLAKAIIEMTMETKDGVG